MIAHKKAHSDSVAALLEQPAKPMSSFSRVRWWVSVSLEFFRLLVRSSLSSYVEAVYFWRHALHIFSLIVHFPLWVDFHIVCIYLELLEGLLCKPFVYNGTRCHYLSYVWDNRTVETADDDQFSIFRFYTSMYIRLD